jgi:hypothetical protein
MTKTELKLVLERLRRNSDVKQYLEHKRDEYVNTLVQGGVDQASENLRQLQWFEQLTGEIENG